MDEHVQAEQGHIAREQEHMWHERRARDEALRHGDVFGAWARQQHLQDEHDHVRREKHHVGDELFDHDD